MTFASGGFVVTHVAAVRRDARHTAAKVAMAWQMAQIARILARRRWNPKAKWL